MSGSKKNNLSAAVYFTPKQVAEKLQISLDNVYGLLKTGSLKSVRIQRQYRIAEFYLDEFLDAC